VCGEPVLTGSDLCKEHLSTTATTAPGLAGTLEEPDNVGVAAVTAAATLDALATGATVGEYVIEGRIGSGGMGDVYAASHPVIGKRAAIKAIKPENCTNPGAVARFVREARVVNEIRHPNIVDVFSIGTLPDGRSYLIMELLEGESLAERLERGALSLGEVAAIIDPVCRALDVAHAAGVVHRDLKPDNIFLMDVPGSERVAKLLDFGIAKLNRTDLVDKTRTDVVIGTPAYLSPEQAKGPDVGPPSDVYSLGVVVFEMLVGRRPFVAGTGMEVIAMHLNEPAPRVRELWPTAPAAIERLVGRMLSKDEGERPSLERVRAVFADFAGSDVARGTGPHTDPDSSSRRWIGVAGLAAVVAAAGAFALYAVGGGGADREAADAASVAMTAPDANAATVLADDVPSPEREPPAQPEPQAEPATLVMDVRTRGARIEIDGREVSANDARAGLAVEHGIDHSVVVTARGYKPFRDTLRIGAGESKSVPVTLRKVRVTTDTRTVPPPAEPPDDPPADPPTAEPSPKDPPPDEPPADDDSLVDPF
jgi:serine/threonine-protein kinase